MKIRGIVISVVALIVIAVVCVFAYKYVSKKDTETNTTVVSGDYKLEQVSYVSKDIYTEQFQKDVDNQIANWKAGNSYTIDQPLLIWNPYKTNTGSMYYYATCEEESYVVCEVQPKKGSLLRNRLKNDGADGYTREHEYLITGLAVGQNNKVRLSYFNKKGVQIKEKEYSFTIKKDKKIPAIINVEKGDSDKPLTQGLFAVLGHDKSTAKNIYYYDNDGVSRGKTPLKDYRTDRILEIDGNMVYSYDLSDIAIVNRLGRVTKTVSLGKYELHHDFMYDEKQRLLLCLVNEEGKDTIEDVLISVDLESGEVKKLVDFEELLKEMRKISVQREGGKNTYGGTELDWLHLNSLDLLNDSDAVFSSREESVLIKVKNIYTNPKMDYLIHSGSLYKGTKYEKLLLKGEGKIVGPAGQHTITVEQDSSLKEGQYYLFFYDNNFGSAKTLPDFDWSLYPGVGTYREGSASYYTKFLVDENKRTYKMVQQFPVPYSSVVSGVNHYEGNITFSSGMDHTYGEYDKDGKMICTYKYDAKRYAYRVIKYNFNGIFYEKGEEK